MFHQHWNGNEYLIENGKPLHYTMVDFWKMAYSDIILNMNRGTFAEFIVRCALEENGFNALSQERAGTEPWDIDGPNMVDDGVFRPSRIEVKCAASVQIDTPDEKEPLSLPSTSISFDIKRAKQGVNDLYVFCHYKAAHKRDNMLDLNNWEFYVLPTSVIISDQVLSTQTHISVYRLNLMGIHPVSFSDLYNQITDIIEKFS